MAAPEQVKQYLSYWFQLGKRVLVHGGQEVLQPERVIVGDRYSPEFEACWQRISTEDAADAHLEGTAQTVAELLSSEWIITSCARCEMPVPMLDLGVQGDASCPCFDLPNWPDTELPQPRSPVSTTDQLNHIRARLMTATKKPSQSLSHPPHSPESTK